MRLSRDLGVRPARIEGCHIAEDQVAGTKPAPPLPFLARHDREGGEHVIGIVPIAALMWKNTASTASSFRVKSEERGSDTGACRLS